ncbi:hypothetical protein TPHA_0J00260 [Tetrapisispora phaffii CBS 4417]|uniref:Uncharacterized protein n=1 Tax=Tetrapisispora phaffii (strain ATCC 24235 / CBS 4417 / NBRC 1672 / NRRL Y-8282 / UCD 70-5) TaxID=1071381 RepID=G8BYA8_TETPH|nr:hypothetical protein TPHA_0J00260 [Tetrapisispora phaffii CBS 4417]CCE64850.1 hypothetical protein TPHA_0J00260 [Tetrapisispora phaffii CBS 4417]
MPFRPLASYERNVLIESYENQTNGTIFSAKYTDMQTNSTINDDAATLLTQNEENNMFSRFINALATVITENPELYTTINTKLEFEPITEIKTDDVISSIKFNSTKDEFVNCKNGAPPYLLRHIFNKDKFVPGSGKPLWNLYIVDDSIVIFHGQDVLFDIYSAASFHRKFFAALEGATPTSEKLTTIFRLSDLSKSALTYPFPKSIYDSPLLMLPAKTIDLVSLQTRFFLKSVVSKTIVKPLNIIMFNDEPMKSFTNSDPMDILEKTSSLCGTTVFGNISNERFDYLQSIAEEENVCTKSLVCGITMLCLKPLIKDFSSNITFSIAMNLRDSIEESTEFGLFYKNVRIEVPLSFIDDNVFKLKTSYNGYDASNSNIKETNPNYEEQLIAYQFNQIATFISRNLKQRMRAWRRNGFNDDDIKMMKFGSKDKNTSAKIIQINDISDLSFCPMNKNGELNSVSLKDLSFTHSLVPDQFMSLSYTHCKSTGSNICIHFPEVYDLELFVEKFQNFIDGGDE